MTRAQLENAINLRTRVYRKRGRVMIEVVTDDIDVLMRFPYAGMGNNVAEAVHSFIKAHKIQVQ